MSQRRFKLIVCFISLLALARDWARGNKSILQTLVERRNLNDSQTCCWQLLAASRQTPANEV